MNQDMNDRLERFDDMFPCLRKEDCDSEHINNWISIFRFYHNHVRKNAQIGRAPMDYNEGPVDRMTIIRSSFSFDCGGAWLSCLKKKKTG